MNDTKLKKIQQVFAIVYVKIFRTIIDLKSKLIQHLSTKYVLEIVFWTLIYITTARLGQCLGIPPGNVTPVWLPSGIFLAVAMIRGHQIWPAIFLGACIGNAWAYFDSSSIMTLIWCTFAAIMNGIGDILSVNGGLYLIEKKTHTKIPFYRGPHVLSFFVYGVLLGPAASAIIGVTSLSMAHIVPGDQFISTLLTWWTGDSTGVLFITPALVSLTQLKKLPPLKERIFAPLFFIALSSIIGIYINDWGLSGPAKVLLIFLVIPLTMTATLSFSQNTLFLGNLFTAFILIISTSFGPINLNDRDLNEQLILLLLVLSVLTSTIILISGIIRDRSIIEEELRQANIKTEKSLQAKGRFLANMSHEIRAPLSIVIGYTELCQTSKKLDQQTLRYIQTISKNALHLKDLIDSFLDFSKIEAGMMKINNTKICIKKEMESIYAMYAEKLKEKDISYKIFLDHKLPKFIWSDPILLRQIFLNLIGNAIKFTKSGSITVTVEVSKVESHFINIHIKDTGIGIGKKDLKLLFQPYSQVDSTRSKQFGGTGLGLVLSKQLSQLLGGDVHISYSRPGEGTTLTIHLPIVVRGDAKRNNETSSKIHS